MILNLLEEDKMEGLDDTEAKTENFDPCKFLNWIQVQDAIFYKNPSVRVLILIFDFSPSPNDHIVHTPSAGFLKLPWKSPPVCCEVSFVAYSTLVQSI